LRGGGIAYDSGFRAGSNGSPPVPVNAAWLFGARGEQQISKVVKWGLAGELLYGGSLDVDKQRARPPTLGGRSNPVGASDDTLSLVHSVHGNHRF
jgi:hypothetical protein